MAGSRKPKGWSTIKPILGTMTTSDRYDRYARESGEHADRMSRLEARRHLGGTGMRGHPRTLNRKHLAEVVSEWDKHTSLGDLDPANPNRALYLSLGNFCNWIHCKVPKDIRQFQGRLRRQERDLNSGRRRVLIFVRNEQQDDGLLSASSVRVWFRVEPARAVASSGATSFYR